MKCPCKKINKETGMLEDCQRRKILCHSTCKEYLEFAKFCEQRRAASLRESEVNAYSAKRRSKLINSLRRAGANISKW